MNWNIIIFTVLIYCTCLYRQLTLLLMLFPVSIYSMHLYRLIIPYNSSLIVCWLLWGQIFIIPVYALISYYIVLQYIAITLGGFISSDDCFVQNALFVHWQCISFKFRSLDQLFFAQYYNAQLIHLLTIHI